MTIKIVVIALLINSIYAGYLPPLDPAGYLTYCPCMGRFGNQVDHFLGSFAFAKALNRTLILPPWVEYTPGKAHSVQVPFITYFEFEPLLDFHRVITMDDFMQHYAKIVWPEDKRVSFCYVDRKSLDKTNTKKDCYAKDGNPFGPFWDAFNIEFVKSEFFSPLHFDTINTNVAETWQERFDPNEWPVLAFTGAPATFPVQEHHRDIQKYLIFTEYYRVAAEDFIKRYLPKGAFVAIHLRNGIDWVRACDHVKDSKQLFASPQCLGYNNEKGNLYPELCMQSFDSITRQLKRLIKTVKHTYKNNEIKSIFVSSDYNYYIRHLDAAFHLQNITAFRTNGQSPHLDLAIMTKANHFIGNCVSSFSAFVKRARDVSGFPSYFWAYPKERLVRDLHERVTPKPAREEL